MHIPSYPSVYAIGHAAIADLFNGPVLVEEKIDGSQFSFGVLGGELCCRSKGKDLIVDAPERMFGQAVQTAQELAPLLAPGWVYRCEYLQKPKHNTLAYARIPERHLILFDVMTGPEQYLDLAAKRIEADRIGLECVPVMYHGVLSALAMLNDFLKSQSCLGGCTVEGVVVKNYALFTGDKKTMMGKYVSEAFKENHADDWKQRNPTPSDVTQTIIACYRTEARWRKAVQHLREAGQLTQSPKDIGPLLKAVSVDLLKEESDAIKETLFKHFWPQIGRAVTAGLPEWYKQELATSAFTSPVED